MSIPSARLHQLTAEHRHKLSSAIVQGAATQDLEDRLDALLKALVTGKPAI